MIKCRECNERLVMRSPVSGVCLLCYETLDMGRFEEYLPPKLKGPFNCERCRDTGKVLTERTEGNPSFMLVVKCECKGGE